jgi:hypothetical protein
MAHIRLHVQQADGGLPMVCMRCGEPATIVKTKKMSYYPRWLLVFVLAGAPGIVILVILALILRKRATLQAPLCDRHQGHWTIRTAISWTAAIAVVLVGIASVVLLILLEENAGPRNADIFALFLCVGGVIVFVGLLILLAILQNTAIRPDDITRTHILLNGVSDAFVTAVEEAEIERRVRLRQWEVEDEADRAPRRYTGDDEPPLRRPPSTDAFEEGPPRPAPQSDAFKGEQYEESPKRPPKEP